MTTLHTINGAYSEEANGWVSEILEITGDLWLEILLPGKGRVVVKKSETADGPWPKAIITPWTGPDFRIRVRHGRTKISPFAPGDGEGHNRFIQIITSSEPTRIEYAYI